jgi:hypothetical protein
MGAFRIVYRKWQGSAAGDCLSAKYTGAVMYRPAPHAIKKDCLLHMKAIFLSQRNAGHSGIDCIICISVAAESKYWPHINAQSKCGIQVCKSGRMDF